MCSINNNSVKCSDAASVLMTEEIRLFPGVSITFWTNDGLIEQPGPETKASCPTIAGGSSNKTIQITFCRSGGLILAGCGDSIRLSPGEFSLHTPSRGRITPLVSSCWLVITVDFDEAAAGSVMLDQLSRCFPAMIERLCPNNAPAFFPEDPQTAAVFEDFYSREGDLRLTYFRLRCIELILYLNSLQAAPKPEQSPCQPELCEIVRRIHDRLTAQMSERITIDDLAKQYLINPTTLKAAFKAVYGRSIAAHIREHRMEEAAKLLRETHMSICEIAGVVGYDSQSKFASAFKGYYGVLPREYRRGKEE